mmetsp:Transcript_14646/g.31112  ORF Transcript_14646/g.31112 Transcript_14646/m.31112 type:complete len:183 (-) Transcript_14646:241-789(-)|eukprot:CAMPEP_0183722102 /NCGR_PEP_ID=MMETSP0737-20130205/14163_1 /TAXON_ID=385413 /ORGANISM="Thalassiosira miniscula, Strain CCMP1093" /LENGTH=182 /DNA_ID=CAMNT_0025952203 /DNA_START=68 /DNA_END=616 /DNA_ORIENTATION=-
MQLNIKPNTFGDSIETEPFVEQDYADCSSITDDESTSTVSSRSAHDMNDEMAGSGALFGLKQKQDEYEFRCFRLVAIALAIIIAASRSIKGDATNVGVAAGLTSSYPSVPNVTSPSFASHAKLEVVIVDAYMYDCDGSAYIFERSNNWSRHAKLVSHTEAEAADRISGVNVAIYESKDIIDA